jgi:competence ComEA-like helix-hairpin-helix protein
MTPVHGPHPRFVAAMSVICLLAAGLQVHRRLGAGSMRWPHDEPPSGMFPEWRIDLDAADPAELALLPGVGAALAERIVADRAANGPFGGATGLDRVPGVGQGVIERIRPWVR